MYYELKEAYWEVNRAPGAGRITKDHLLAEVRRIGVEELNLPAVTVDLFLEVKGYTNGSRDCHRLAWKLATQYLCPANAWLSTEEARATGAWEQALRAAGWAFHVFRAWGTPTRNRAAAR